MKLSRFVWMSTATTGRHIDPMGHEHVQAVKLGNMLLARSMMLVLIAAVRGLHFAESLTAFRTEEG